MPVTHYGIEYVERLEDDRAKLLGALYAVALEYMVETIINERVDDATHRSLMSFISEAVSDVTKPLPLKHGNGGSAQQVH